MTRMSITSLVVVSGLMLPTAPARAQNLVSGAIAGVVRDTTGAVLPGVTVEAASPALIEKFRSVVTDGQGLYRIVDLRPGVYALTFTLTGFNTVRREDIELTTGFTAPVNVEMKVGSLEETITVSGKSPTVDVQNVNQQSVLSRTILDTVPTNKTIQGYASLIVGAVNLGGQDVGGNKAESGNIQVHGGPQEVRMLADGFRYNSPEITGDGAGRNGLRINTGSTQEVVLETGGISPESSTGAVQLNLIPKEGGNTFAVYLVGSYANSDLQSNNLTEALRRRGATQAPVKEIHDINPALGGPIKRDKLWFYTAHRWWATSQYVPGNYYSTTQDSWFYTPDLNRPAYSDTHNKDNSLRLTWQASEKNKFNLYYSTQDNRRLTVGGNTSPEAAAYHRMHPTWMASASWSYPATNRLLFDGGMAVVIWDFNAPLRPGVSLDTISVTEASTNYQYRARAGLTSAAGYGNFYANQSNQRFSASYITGSHHFKGGMSMLEGWRAVAAYVNRDVSYTFLNRVPQSITQWATTGDLLGSMRDYGIYGQDQWSIQRLTLNLGVRFDYLNAWVPAQHFPAGTYTPERDYGPVKDVPKWSDLTPRLGAAYDLFGTGKTALKVAWGRYVIGESFQLANASNPGVASVNSANRTWNDANGDFIPQPGELGPLSNANFGQVNITTRYADDVREGFSTRPDNWQVSTSIQHEMRPGLALNVGYFRNSYGHFMATDNLAVAPADYDTYCITAPVDVRLPGGGGNRLCGLYDVTLAKFGQVNNLIVHAEEFGTRRQVFNGVDVTLNARFGTGGLFSGGFSTGRTVTDNCLVVDSPQAAREGFCRVSPPLSAATQVKFSGVYALPWGLQASAVFQNLPGIPILGSYVATNAEIVPSLGRNLASGVRGTATIDLIPPGTLYEDRITQLDVRLTKIIRIGRARLQGMIDVYNMFNASSVLQTNTRYGPAWLQPTEILGARLLKFGAQIDF